MRTSVTFTNRNPNTIWNRLAARLGREPTDAEATAEVRRILFGESAPAHVVIQATWELAHQGAA